MYYSEIPTKLDKSSMKKNDWVKARTQELYDMLPQTTLSERNKFTNIRDEIIEINYPFFGYIAKHTKVTDPIATYEDKLQVALISFCDMWAKYKYAPVYSPEMDFKEDTKYEFDDYVYHEGTLYRCKVESGYQGKWDKKYWGKVNRYRTDLAFTVFFKIRLSECVTRELNLIKYSVRRQVCMKAAEQLNKHWGKITKEDISKVNLPLQDMQTLEAIFSTQYDTPYEDDYQMGGREVSHPERTSTYWIDNIYTEQYDSLEDLILHEMVEQESKLDDAYLLKMSSMYGIPFADLERARPIGEAKLKQQLEESIYIKDSFEAESGFGDNSDIED